MKNEHKVSALRERARSWFEFDAGPPDSADEEAISAREAALTLVPTYAPGESPPYSSSSWHTLQVEALRFLSSREESFPERLACVVADLLTSAPLAPPLRFVDALREPSPPISLVFAAWPHVTHELWPLMVDALIEGGAQAVHDTWLTSDMCVTRALRYDVYTDRLVEGGIAEPQQLERVLLLMGPTDSERAWHERLDELCRDHGVTVLNPYSTARIADDKWETFTLWLANGVPTPDTTLITSKTAQSAEDVVRHIMRIRERVVVKPRYGTAARHVTITPDVSTAVDAIRTTLRADDVIVQPFRNALRWVSGDATAYPAVVRLNVACNWRGNVRAESGYVHVASNAANFVANVAQHGCGRAIVREHLTVDGVLLADFETRMIESVAEDAVRALVTGAEPCIMGVDVVAERDDTGVIQPYVIDANPRPAGLPHSRFLTADWELPGDPGVTLTLWKYAP